MQEKLKKIEHDVNRSITATTEVVRILEERQQEMSNQIQTIAELQNHRTTQPTLELATRRWHIKYILPEFKGDT